MKLSNILEDLIKEGATPHKESGKGIITLDNDILIHLKQVLQLLLKYFTLAIIFLFPYLLLS